MFLLWTDLNIPAVTQCREAIMAETYFQKSLIFSINIFRFERMKTWHGKYCRMLANMTDHDYYFVPRCYKQTSIDLEQDCLSLSRCTRSVQVCFQVDSNTRLQYDNPNWDLKWFPFKVLVSFNYSTILMKVWNQLSQPNHNLNLTQLQPELGY